MHLKKEKIKKLTKKEHKSNNKMFVERNLEVILADML